MTERDDQAALFEWAELQAGTVPELRLLAAVPNGQYRPGQRPEPGIKRGFPDIILPVARQGYHSLFIELKYGKNKTSAIQREWLDALALEGSACYVCYGFDEAKAVIEWYLGV